nr:unnamed protein product [Callosobruchus analis]
MDHLKRQRGGIKANLTSFNKYVASFQEKADVSEKEFVELATRLNNMEERVLNKFYSIQEQIEMLCPDDQIEVEYVEKEAFENHYYSLVALAKQLMNQNEPVKAQGLSASWNYQQNLGMYLLYIESKPNLIMLLPSKTKELPTVEDLKSFLNTRAEILELLEQKRNDRMIANFVADQFVKVATVHCACSEVSDVLLSTAHIGVIGRNGKRYTLRALLDSGAQSSFITESACNLLGIVKEMVNVSVKGINGVYSNIMYKCNVDIFSINSDFTKTLYCFQLPNITVSELEIQNDLRKFWEIEEPCHALPALSNEEKLCEKHFVDNTCRDKNGTFIVKLPFKQDLSKLGDSYNQAEKRFLNLEENYTQIPIIENCTFCSNNDEILEWLPDNDELAKIVTLGEDDFAKILSLTWCPILDKLQYDVKELPDSEVVSKRMILSGSSKLFEPLGLISPCLIQIKILLQNLWLQKASWDEALPPNIATKWKEFKSEMKALKSLKIHRQALCKNAVSIEIHIFCDSSEKAYCSCAYIKSSDVDGNSTVHLLIAKSKVVPLKTVTLPRLELCGAVVGARLGQKVKQALKLENVKLVFWTDSTIVLGWLNSAPRNKKTFVSNRVAKIQELTSTDIWRHVPSSSNPADLVSRGRKTNELIKANIWWNGPSWLHSNENCWPENPCVKQELPDVRKNVEVYCIKTNACKFTLFEKYFSLGKLVRITALVVRFISNCKVPTEHRQFNHLTIEELDVALDKLVRIAQNESFYDEIQQIKHGEIDKKSKLISLNPFIDSWGILRVGGRLCNATYEKKHPLILSKEHPLSVLIAKDYHMKLLHAGPRHMLSAMREKYWIISALSLVKKVVRNCIKCFRFKPKTISPIMGNLPQERLEPSRIFDIVGVDYAGPFLIKDKAGRGASVVKGYVALSVCFVSKAVHLELVTGLSKDAFILALRRFIARRGKPKLIFSDNGTNFIDWKFIPPQSPHFGGLWEAGIKRMKHHLKRVVCNVKLTFENFYTLLTEVECLLNSRPISPLSSNPMIFFR